MSDQVFGGVFEYNPDEEDDLAWVYGDEIEVPNNQTDIVLPPPQGIMPQPDQAGNFMQEAAMDDEPLPFAMPPPNADMQDQILPLFQNMGEDGVLIANEQPNVAALVFPHQGPPAW